MSTKSLWPAAFLSITALGWMACSSDPAGTGSAGSQGVGAGSMAGGSSSGGGMTGTGGSGGGSAKVPLFETDIVPILNKSCGAGNTACHADVAYAASVNFDCRGWLALPDQPLGSKYYSGPDQGKPTGCPDLPLYERLLQLAAWQECNGVQKKYVVPCDVEASYLFDKIDDGPYCGETPNTPSEKMPKGTVMDPVEKETIRAWILAGAPRVDGTGTQCGGSSSSSSSSSTSSTSSGSMMGKPPQATINHPGDMEMRVAGVLFPFIGVANDPEDGALSGASLVWTSDLSGQIGTGTMFDATLPVGTHKVTLTATDKDGNKATDSLTLYMK